MLPLFALPEQAESSTGNETRSAGSSISSQAPGKAPVFFERKTDGGYLVRFESGTLRAVFPATLISIDKKNLKDLGEKQIKELLYGPVGSSVILEIMMSDGKIRTAKLEREVVSKQSLWKRDLSHYQNYDNRSDRNWNGAFVEDSLDIEARATQNLVLRTAMEWPEQKSDPVGTAAFPAAMTNYEVGNLDDGDAYLDLCEKLYKPGEKWFLRQNRQPSKSIKILVSVGRLNDAQHLLDRLVAGGGLQPFFYYDAFKTLALAQLKTDTAAALATVEKFRVLTNGRGPMYAGRNWVAEVYRQVGEYKKAQEIYAGLIASTNLTNSEWENLETFAGYLFEQASLQSLQGEKAVAAASLEKAIEKLNSLGPEQLEAIETAPGVFPKPSDLQGALVAIQSSHQLPKNPVPIEVSDSSFPNIRECHDAIRNNDKDLVDRLIHCYLEQYRSNVQQPLASSGKQNLYCSILTLAREISDRGWLELSDDVLRTLQQEAEGKDANPVARTFLQAELVYNATKEKSNEASEWTRLNNNLSGMERSGGQAAVYFGNFAWSERLRRLAVLFYYAGELKRAEAFINQSLAACENASGHDTKVADSFDGIVGEKAMILLDAACIAANQNQFEKAGRYWEQIVALPAVPAAGYYHTIIELCSVLAHKKKRDQAIEMLRALRSKSKNVGQGSNEQIAMDLALAKLLLDSGKVNEADSIVQGDAYKVPQRLGWSQCVLIAQCAEAAGDFGRAAKYYAMAPWMGKPFEFETDDDSLYLNKALELADRSPNFDNKALAKLCKQVADSLGYQHAPQAYKLYKRACDLTQNSDPEKSELLRLVANFLPYSSNSSRKTGDSNLVDEQLGLEEAAARSAEQNHSQDVRFLWSQLAANEISAERILKGLEDEHHVMQLYSKKDSIDHNPMLPDNFGFITILVNKGHKAEAERFLIEAVARTKAIAGPKSVAVQAQLGDLFAFYVDQKRYAPAMATLDEMLSFDLTTGETPSQAAMHSHCGAWPQAADAVEVLDRIFRSLDQVESQNPGFVEACLEKVLKAQKAALKPNDERLVATLGQLGEVNFQMQKYKAADAYYGQAFEITNQHQKGELAVRMVGRNFINNLRKLGKGAEADKLSELQYAGLGKP
jgi:tetratricopeptide (TPR) repeat protein